MKQLALSTAIAAVLAPSFSFASDTLDDVVVTATRTAQTADEALVPVTLITREDIERTQATTVAEALRSVPGLFVSSNGGAGKATSVFLRGTESDHVLVLLDGIKVGAATSGTTSFENLPIELIERIEVVRGPRASLYGSEALGGVIQIFTCKGGGALTPSFSLSAGSDQTWKGSASLSGGGNRAWLNAGVSGVDTEGFNACDGTSSAGCFTYEPDRDGYEERAASLRAGTRFGKGHSIEAFTLRTEGESEFDGTFQNQSETMQQVLGARLNLHALEAWSMTFQAGRSQDESDNFKDGVFSSTFDTERDTLSWQNDVQIGTRQLLSLGIDRQTDRVDSADIQSFLPGFQGYTVTGRDNTGVFGQYQGDFGAHDLQAALRRDDNDQFGNKTTGNLNWGYALGAGLRLTAGYGTAFKAPSFNELYYPGFGNPDLAPESSRSVEVGLKGKYGWGGWSVHAFQTEIDDLIAYNAAIFAPDNVDEARIRGLEGMLTTHVAGFDLSAALTLLEPENRSEGANQGKVLPRRARESLSLDIDRRLGVWSFGTGLYAAGKRYDDLANTVELDPYATLDLRAEYAIQRDWRLQAKVTNLFDADYETAAWYNQPGRGFLVTLRYQPSAR